MKLFKEHLKHSAKEKARPPQPPPPPSGPPFRLTELPTEIIILLLDIIKITQGAPAIESLLNAFPLLAPSFCLIISDSKTHPFAVFNVPHAHTLYLEDLCARPWAFNPARFPLIVLSLSDAESAIENRRLSRQDVCPYGRFMSLDPILVFRTHTTAGLPYIMIMDLAEKHKVRTIHHTVYKPDNFIEYNHTTFPYVIKPSGNYPTITPRRSSKITHVELVGYDEFQLSSTELEYLRCRPTDSCFTANHYCIPKAIHVYAPRLRDLYVSFKCAKIPRVTTYPEKMKKHRPTPKDDPSWKPGKFSLVNESWSFLNPYGVMASCPHTNAWRPADADQAEQISRYVNYMGGFEGSFDKFYFYGIPDYQLTHLNEGRHTETLTSVTWMRLTPNKTTMRLNSIARWPITLSFPSAQYFTLFSVLHEETNNPIPFLSLPSVKTLRLFALGGSEVPWDLGLLLHEGSELNHVTTVHMSNISEEATSDAPLAITALGLTPIRANVQELHIMEYNPTFVLQQDHTMTNQALPFLQLRYLRIDMSSIPHKTFHGEAMLNFKDEQFPNLTTICLDMNDPGPDCGASVPESFTVFKILSVPETRPEILITSLNTATFYIEETPCMTWKHLDTRQADTLTSWKSLESEGCYEFSGAVHEAYSSYRSWAYSL